MSFGERGGYKPPEALQEQLERAQQTIGTEPEHSLVPPSHGKDILQMPVAEIKQKFTRRYEMYLKLLRAQRREDGGELVLSQHDISEMQKWLKGLNALDQYITAHKTGETEVLRERQVPIFEDLRDYIEQGGKAGYVKLPTGVGKTVLFTELIEALDFKTLIVVPTTPLLEQTVERVEEFAPDLEVGRISRHAKEHGRQVAIITYDSFINQVRDGKIAPEDYECVILDEVHTSLSPKRSETVQKFPDALKLGFTATAEYSESKKVSDLLPDEIHRMNIREAVEEGLISSFSAMVARTNVDLSKVSLTSAGEYKEEELAKAVNIAGRNKAAVELYQKRFASETAVAYCVNIKHAEAVARAFNEAGVTAEVVSGDTPRTEQRRILQEYKQGKIKVICNADILIPGFDEPRASVCLNLRPTRSRVIAEQRGGRVLRTYKKQPNKHAYVVDFIDQGMDEKNPPILFADVAEGAQFFYKGRKDSASSDEGGKRIEPPSVDIPGLEVVTDVEEIMKIVGKYRSKEIEREKQVWLEFSELRAAVLKMGVKSGEYYIKIYQNHPGWPSTPWNVYPEWPGWRKFLGTENTDWRKGAFPTLVELQVRVRGANIESGPHYKREYRSHQGWPSSPDETYASEWPGWRAFLGTDFPEYSAFQVVVREAGILNGEEYIRRYKEHSEWPAAPQHVYADQWPGWPAFLGTETRKFLSYSETKAQVQAAHILSQKEYKEKYKDHPGWPSNPNAYYKKEWSRWEDFVGSMFLSYSEIMRQVQALGIRNGEEYRGKYKDHPGWPSNPNNYYGDQWPGWPAFLGTENVDWRKPEYLLFDELQAKVRTEKIQSAKEYVRAYKMHQGWPSHPDAVYADQWRGWPEFLGKK